MWRGNIRLNWQLCAIAPQCSCIQSHPKLSNIIMEDFCGVFVSQEDFCVAFSYWNTWSWLKCALQETKHFTVTKNAFLSFVWCTPTLLSDELKYCFISTIRHVPNVCISVDFTVDVKYKVVRIYFYITEMSIFRVVCSSLICNSLFYVIYKTIISWCLFLFWPGRFSNV